GRVPGRCRTDRIRRGRQVPVEDGERVDRDQVLHARDRRGQQGQDRPTEVHGRGQGGRQARPGRRVDRVPVLHAGGRLGDRGLRREPPGRGPRDPTRRDQGVVRREGRVHGRGEGRELRH